MNLMTGLKVIRTKTLKLDTSGIKMTLKVKAENGGMIGNFNNMYLRD